jgi:hypothetical protein
MMARSGPSRLSVRPLPVLAALAWSRRVHVSRSNMPQWLAGPPDGPFPSVRQGDGSGRIAGTAADRTNRVWSATVVSPWRATSRSAYDPSAKDRVGSCPT